jgi:predicted nucleotidyltransferase
MITKEEIIKASGIHPARILNIYLFGSRVYGNASDNSDWDVIMIAKTSSSETEIKTDKFKMV